MSRQSIQKIKAMLLCIEYDILFVDTVDTYTGVCGSYTTPYTEYYEVGPSYKARHTHKHLYTVLPKYSKIQVLPGITSCRLMKYNKQAIELNSLLMKTYAKDGLVKL